MAEAVQRTMGVLLPEEGLGAWMAHKRSSQQDQQRYSYPAAGIAEQHSLGLQVPGDSTLGLLFRGSEEPLPWENAE